MMIEVRNGGEGLMIGNTLISTVAEEKVCGEIFDGVSAGMNIGTVKLLLGRRFARDSYIAL